MKIRVSNNRAILTAMALLITGCILSSMAHSFFQSLRDAGLNRSRLWWEIVLNLQILCGALVWFSFVERIKVATGHMYYVRCTQFFVALVATLLPVLIGLAGIALGWFEKRPDVTSLNWLIAGCLLLWCAGMLLPIIVQAAVEGRWRVPLFLQFRGPVTFVARLWPLLATIILISFEGLNGGEGHYIYGPILLYIQGALPYLMRAVHLE